MSIIVLLAAAAALYFIGLGAHGWGNDYYAAAAQAGADNGKAFFFGASDAPASITVDKPPLSIWLMAMSVRMLGLSPFAVLLPEAFLGVATIAAIYATVRRVASPQAALIAGAVAVTTPIVALVFRYSNPDALLTALLALAAYLMVRAAEHARLRWVVLVGAVFGLAFLTKQMQAFLTVPGFIVFYLIAAPIGLRARIRQICISLMSLAVTAAVWIAVVELTPASAHPYIGGSTTNSFLELTLGYNGIGRLLGGSGNSTDGAGSAVRLFTGASSLAVSWLLPAALILGVAALVFDRRRYRTDRRRALIVGSLTALIVSGLAFSAMSGIYHSYYTAATVPALAMVLGTSAEVVAQHRRSVAARAVLTAAIGATAVWGIVLLGQAPDFLAPLKPIVALCGLAAAAAFAVIRLGRRRFAAAATLAVVTALLAPASVAIVTASAYHTGSGPVAGFASSPDSRADPTVVSVLEQSRGYDWAAATVGSTTAARYQLASRQPVMPIGGFTHHDPSPTLEQFQSWTAAGRIHWFFGNEGEIANWVKANYAPIRVGDVVLYDLSERPVTSAVGNLGG